MARGSHALWSGSVTFGLVSVPVAMLPGLRSGKAATHLLHRDDASPLKRRMYCPAENVFVHPEHIQRGYEIEPGRHVIVTDEEIRSVAPKRSTTIEIRQFVDAGAISPAYYDRPYYLVPTGAEKPYQLLVETLAETRKAGLSEFVMHAREHVSAVTSIDGALCLLVLRYRQQLRSPEGLVGETDADADDVRTIGKAIEQHAGAFDPDQLTDEYRRRLDRLIEKKRRQDEIVAGPELEPEPAAAEQGADDEEVDLVAALEASLAREKAKSP